MMAGASHSARTQEITTRPFFDLNRGYWRFHEKGRISAAFSLQIVEEGFIQLLEGALKQIGQRLIGGRAL